MIKNSFTLYGMTILAELLRDVLVFPLWWYSWGLLNFIKALANFIKNQERSLALRVWIKNIFRPMYGQTDWQGILVSIFMRLIQIIFRSIWLFLVIILCFCLILAWLVLPVLVVYQILMQFNAYLFTR